MNVPDYVWEQISELLDLGISLIPIIVMLSLIVFVGVIAIFVTIIKREKEAKRIAKENDKKAKEFERKFKQEIEEHFEKAERISENKRERAEEFERNSKKNKERIETFRKKHFPNDD